MDQKIRESKSVEKFKNSLLNFIRPKPNTIFRIHNPLGIKLLTRLRVGFSHLREHKFKHNFQDTLNPLCNCGLEVETTVHFFLHCHNFIAERETLLSRINDVDNNIRNKSDKDLTQILLFGDQNLNEEMNTVILNSSH